MSSFGKGTRRWTAVIAMIVVLALLAEIGNVRFGWWQWSHATIGEKPGGYGAAAEPATLPDALATAHRALDEIEHNVRDYSAVIVKRERSGDRIAETVMFAKIREKPFSVYLYFFARRNDASVKGREVLYVEGRNDGRLLVHTPGFIAGRLGTLALDPKGWIVMSGERHPITDIGLAGLCRQLIQRGESARDPSQVQVRRYEQARINTRACTLLEITFPAHGAQESGYLARVFVDRQWHFPIRVEAYELPPDRNQAPRLIEEYTYLEVKLNRGYSDADFDRKNPQYRFP